MSSKRVHEQTRDRARKRWLDTGSRKWRRLREHILQRDPFCKICGRRFSVIADHINGRSDRPEDYDETNLQGVCWSCHSVKTNAQLANKDYGCDVDGNPLAGWRR